MLFYKRLLFLCCDNFLGHQDGSCLIARGDRGEGETVMAIQSEVRLVCPRKNERVKVVGGKHRGSLAKLIGLDGSDGIVKLDDTLDVKILDLGLLAKLAMRD